MFSCWSGRGVREASASHMRRRESISSARSGKWCFRMNPMYRKRSIRSLSEPAKSGAGLSTGAGTGATSHGRRRWRQRLHGMPSSHFSLRRRHSAQLRDGRQFRFYRPCWCRPLKGSAVLRADGSLSLLDGQMAPLCRPWVLSVHSKLARGVGRRTEVRDLATEPRRVCCRRPARSEATTGPASTLASRGPTERGRKTYIHAWHLERRPAYTQTHTNTPWLFTKFPCKTDVPISKLGQV